MFQFTYVKYFIHSNLAVKRNPELNLKLLGNVNHNKKHTDIDLDVRYGANVKDESRHIDMAFEVNRNMKSVMQAQGDIMTRFRFPGMVRLTIYSTAHQGYI